MIAVMKLSKEFKIGTFVVSVLFVSFFLINYLRGEDIFDREMELVAEYDSVDGLAESAPVFIKGYKAGKVTEVRYSGEDDDFKVVCSVRKDFNIPSDSRMTIYGVDIMGGKGIRIDLGTSDVFAHDGDTLSSSMEAAMLDGLVNSVTPLLDKAGVALDSLTVTVSAVNRLMSEENTASLARTLKHLESVIEDMSGIAAAVEGRSEELESFIMHLDSVSCRLEGIAGKADSVMDGVSSIVTSINESDINGLTDSFYQLLENINDPEGTVGKLLTDDSVYNSIDALLSDVDSLVRKIEENPKKYIKISVF